MMRSVTEKEHKEGVEKLRKFCEEERNHCLMYNYMLTIENLRNEAVDKYKRKLKDK